MATKKTGAVIGGFGLLFFLFRVGLHLWAQYGPAPDRHDFKSVSQEHPEWSSQSKTTSGSTAQTPAPVTFYGKVADQFGQPIPAAKVAYVLKADYNGPEKTIAGVSDEAGLFTMATNKGAILKVTVSKEDYLPIDKQSSGSFCYADLYSFASYRFPTPTEDRPALFVLRKKFEPLVPFEKEFSLPEAGGAVEISLPARQASQPTAGQLKIELAPKKPLKRGPAETEWTCRLSVIGGGVQFAADPDNATAPAEGYSPTVEIPPAHHFNSGRYEYSANFFIQLPNGCFARSHFWLVKEGSAQGAMKGFANFKSGSRELQAE